MTKACSNCKGVRVEFPKGERKTQYRCGNPDSTMCDMVVFRTHYCSTWAEMPCPFEDEEVEDE